MRRTGTPTSSRPATKLSHLLHQKQFKHYCFTISTKHQTTRYERQCSPALSSAPRLSVPPSPPCPVFASARVRVRLAPASLAPVVCRLGMLPSIPSSSSLSSSPQACGQFHGCTGDETALTIATVIPSPAARRPPRISTSSVWSRRSWYVLLIPSILSTPHSSHSTHSSSSHRIPPPPAPPVSTGSLTPATEGAQGQASAAAQAPRRARQAHVS